MTINDRYHNIRFKARHKIEGFQKFSTVVLSRFGLVEIQSLQSDKNWVNKLLRYYSGNLVRCEVLAGELSLELVGVYIPAWPVDIANLTHGDTTGVQLTQNEDVWVGRFALVSIGQRRD